MVAEGSKSGVNGAEVCHREAGDRRKAVGNANHGCSFGTPYDIKISPSAANHRPESHI